MDAAALSGVSTTTVHGLSGRSDIREAVKAIVEADFRAQIAKKRSVEAALKSAEVEAMIGDGTLTTKVCYSAEVKTSFMHALGIASVQMENCAQARASIPTYYSIHAIVDASGSMGIGASVADQTLMESRLGYAFACHTLNWGQQAFAPLCDTRDWFSRTPNCASRIGATTRFDVVRQRLIEMVDKAMALNKLPGQFSFAVHKFSTEPTQVQANTTNLADVKAALTNMTMDQAGAGTNLRYALQSILSSIPPGGDGTSASSPKVFVVILSDGVEGSVNEICTIRPGESACRFWAHWTQDTRLTLNFPGFWANGARSQVIDPAICTPFKTLGATVMTLHTEYVTPPGGNDRRFAMIQSMLVPELKKRFQACASSPELAYSALTPSEIQAAMDKIFDRIAISPRIIQ